MMNAAGIACPRWQVPQVTIFWFAAAPGTLTVERYLMLISWVIRIMVRAMFFCGFASEAKSRRCVAGFPAWQNEHSTPSEDLNSCMMCISCLSEMSLGSTWRFVGLGILWRIPVGPEDGDTDA